jgi:hypothetical protein
VGVGAECWACVMHVSCAVSPCVDCGACTVVQLCRLSVCCVACCLLCRLWVHALRCLIYIYIYHGNIHSLSCVPSTPLSSMLTFDPLTSPRAHLLHLTLMPAS